MTMSAASPEHGERELMALRFESELPNAEQYWGLFQTTGWNAGTTPRPKNSSKRLPTVGIASPPTMTNVWLALDAS